MGAFGRSRSLRAPAFRDPAAAGETFNIAAPAAFSYDVLARHIADRLDLPVVKFTCRDAHDFRIDITKARSALGYRPQWDALRIADDAIRWRQAGGRRTPVKYVG